MGKRTVWLGKKILFFPAVTHWAVMLGDDRGDWYEIDGAGKKTTGAENYINGGQPGNAYYGKEAISGAAKFAIVGTTVKSDSEIYSFNKEWLANNPTYDFTGDNCQTYAYNFIQWVTNGSFNLPAMEAGHTAWADSPNAYAAASDGVAAAHSSTGKAGGQWNVFRAEAEGPMAGAAAMASTSSGFGAFADASLGRAEVNVGKIAKVSLDPNVNTGVGYRDGMVSAKFLGLGLSAGERGVGLHTPLGSIEACNVM